MNSVYDTYDTLCKFAHEQAEMMFRPASGYMKHSYIDPGGPYSENLWDWDSYWAATALFTVAEKLKDSDMLSKVKTHALGSLLNFFDHQGKDGSLPILMSTKDADWFDSVDKPENNMAKPVQALFLRLLVEKDAISQIQVQDLLHRIKLAAECRNRRYRHENSGLLVWANDIAIGIDDDPAIWGRPAFSGAHIFYNSFLAMDLEAAAVLSEKFHLKELHQYFLTEYKAIVKAINMYAWDNRDGWYYSCDVQCRQNLRPHRHFPPLNTYLEPFWRVMPLRIRGYSGLLPLVAQIASPEQAKRVVEKLINSEEFWCDYGIRTMSKIEDRFYEPTRFRGNPSNWLGPVWIISSYLAYLALKNYGYDTEAGEIAVNTRKLLAADYEQNGLVHEYYSPDDGHPISGPGFLNWNLLVFCMES